MKYVAPSVATIETNDLWPFVRRALPLIRAVRSIPRGWTVNGHLVTWREGRGWECDCENWGRYGKHQGGICKHVLAVCMRADSYRARMIEASEEERP